MKHIHHSLRLSIAMLAAILAGPDPALHAQVGTPVPHSIDHEAQLIGIDAKYTTSATAKGFFKFALVNGPATTATTGTAFWKNDHNVPPLTTVGQSPVVEPAKSVQLPVTAGGYGLLLGAEAGTLGIPYDAIGHADLRVRTWFSRTGLPGSFVWQKPDMPIPAAAYAMQVPDGSIKREKIALEAVDAPQLAKGAVGVGKIGTGAVNAGNLLAQGTPASGLVLGYNGASLVWTAPGKGDGIWALNPTADAYFSSGKVGIGTPDPKHRLSVAGGPYWTSSYWQGAMSFENAAALGWKPNLAGYGFGLGHTDTGFCIFRTKSNPGDVVNGALYDLFISDAGIVGINTVRPADGNRLHVNGNALISTAGGENIQFGRPNGETGVSISGPLRTTPTGFTRHRADMRFDGLTLKLVAGTGSLPAENGIAINTAGNVGVGTVTPKARLDVIGTTRTSILTITGGADIAEPFQMKEGELAKGSVVVIDEAHPGRLRLSTRAYDARVAGIISGANGINPGIALHQEGVIEGGQNVALTGRVYVHADASRDPIRPGDLLTTSDLPGHAMKVSDHSKAQGAVIGKAMSALEEGTGMVLVLVTLQ